MKKKLTKSIAKKKAWKAFQTYKRTQWTLHGPIKCYTCDRLLTFKQVQVGHWYPGHGNIVYINELYVRPQDFYCNIQLNGNQGEFRDRIRKELGNKVVNKLLLEAKGTKDISVEEYLELEEKYKTLTDSLHRVII